VHEVLSCQGGVRLVTYNAEANFSAALSIAIITSASPSLDKVYTCHHHPGNIFLTCALSWTGTRIYYGRKLIFRTWISKSEVQEHRVSRCVYSDTHSQDMWRHSIAAVQAMVLHRTCRPFIKQIQPCQFEKKLLHSPSYIFTYIYIYIYIHTWKIDTHIGHTHSSTAGHTRQS